MFIVTTSELYQNQQFLAAFDTVETAARCRRLMAFKLNRDDIYVTEVDILKFTSCPNTVAAAIRSFILRESEENSPLVDVPSSLTPTALKTLEDLYEYKCDVRTNGYCIGRLFNGDVCAISGTSFELAEAHFVLRILMRAFPNTKYVVVPDCQMDLYRPMPPGIAPLECKIVKFVWRATHSDFGKGGFAYLDYDAVQSDDLPCNILKQVQHEALEDMADNAIQIKELEETLVNTKKKLQALKHEQNKIYSIAAPAAEILKYI